MKKLTALLSAFFAVLPLFADIKTGISGSIEWDSPLLKAAVSLDLSSAGIKLPAGRTQGESILIDGYLRLIRPGILELQVDSSSTIADLINRGEFNLYEAEELALKAESTPPALSPDMKNMSISYTLELSYVSTALLRHSKPSPVMRTLSPVSTAQYTGIIVIAAEKLPVHGMKSSALAVPCLFPKIWDSNMNLIFDRNMLDRKNELMVRYSAMQNIFQNNPSGLTDELRAIVGERPLRIFARGLFGTKPTDLIIDNSDALLIISSPENRRLLAEGKVVFILDDSVLKSNFTGQ